MKKNWSRRPHHCRRRHRRHRRRRHRRRRRRQCRCVVVVRGSFLKPTEMISTLGEENFASS